MALKSIIYKADVQIADMDRHYYADHALTLARHPSETDERMMVRLLAFMLQADARLEFAKGLSDTDEPDLWQRDLTGRIEKWIEVGQPDERRVLRACGRADHVWIYTYGGRTSELWWRGIEGKLQRARNLSVVALGEGVAAQLAELVERTMRLQFTLQDGQIWLGDGQVDPVAVELVPLKHANGTA